jgi:hypothetical protein
LIWCGNRGKYHGYGSAPPRFCNGLLRYAPALELDEATGVMRLSPGARDASTHTITVRVQNGQGGVDVQGFDLEVTNRGHS